MNVWLTNAWLTNLAEYIAGMSEELERAKAENAKLREERDHWHVEQVHAYSNWEDAHKRAIELEVENAKLREYAKAYLTSIRFGCEPCPYCVPDSCEPDTLPLRDGCRLYKEMRELGIEVE